MQRQGKHNQDSFLGGRNMGTRIYFEDQKWTLFFFGTSHSSFMGREDFRAQRLNPKILIPGLCLSGWLGAQGPRRLFNVGSKSWNFLGKILDRDHAEEGISG